MMNNFQSKIRRFLFQEFIPVTKTTAVLCGAGTVLYYLFLLANIHLENFLALDAGRVWTFPWTLFSYPLFNPDLLTLLLEILWLWFVGGSLERSWGSRKYGAFLLTSVGVTGLLMALTAQFLIGGIVISGLLLPLVSITWAWSILYPDQEMLFFGIIPIQARWTAWITAALTVWPYFYNSVSNRSNEWLLGIVSLSGIPVAYLFIYDYFSGRRGYRRRNPGLSSKNRYESTRNKPNRKKFRVIK